MKIIVLAIFCCAPLVSLAQSKPDIDNNRLSDVLDWRQTASYEQRRDSDEAKAKKLLRLRDRLTQQELVANARRQMMDDSLKAAWRRKAKADSDALSKKRGKPKAKMPAPKR